MNTPLPKAVQRQLEEAEAIQAAMQAPADEPVSEAPAEAVEAPVVSVPEQPSVETTSNKQSDDPAYWKQRFNTLQGMMNQEVGKLSAQLKERDSQLQEIMQKVDTLTQQKASPEKSKLVTDADVDAFGSDLVDMVRRAAREEFDSLARVFATEMDKRYGAVAAKADRAEQVVAKTASDKFWDSVVGAHKDFDVVNQDPRWFQYLDQRPKGSKLTNRQSAEAAIGDLDAQTLIDLLDLFKQSLGIAQTQTPAKPKPNLNAQVAPSSSRASAPAEPNTGKIWSGAEYAAALDHRNMQRMTRAEYDALVADAEAAFAEGRVKF